MNVFLHARHKLQVTGNPVNFRPHSRASKELVHNLFHRSNVAITCALKCHHLTPLFIATILQYVERVHLQCRGFLWLTLPA